MFLRYTFLAWVWAIIITILCLLPGDKMPEDIIKNADKIYHAGAFGLLSFLFAFGFLKQFKFPTFSKYASLFSFLFSTFLGGLIELLQHYFIKNRFGDLLDWAFDIVGIILGIILLLICRYVPNINNGLHR